MRIIAGTYKSRKLIAPKGDVTRPTSDRARESLFNVLNNLIGFDGISVLDLFAGSGAFAFEALSRGAERATLVEQNRKVIGTINENAETLEVQDKIEIIIKDVYSWINHLPAPSLKMRGGYDIIFADPPYDDSQTVSDLPEAIFSSRLLNVDCIVIIEHRKGSHVVIPSNSLLIRELESGEAVFSIMKRSVEVVAS
jgi:16S rRNA (guanine(966)-N(2))-methyltransferase RsmD